MKLKNIQTRKDFIKTNEIFAGTSGGVGNNDGFANNAKMKDTVLGKLTNGLFKGIGWLWRKSKAMFVINRLVAKLLNELIRGIILYCFYNNLDISTGKKLEENKELKNSEAEAEESEEAEEAEAEKSEETEIESNPQTEKEKEQETIKEPERIEFEIIKKDIPEFDINKPSPEILKIAEIPVDVNKIVDIDDQIYKNVTKELYDFLNNNIENYENMNPEDKQKLQNIYINYIITKNLNKKVQVQVENVKYVNEAIARPKLSTPEAGKTILPTVGTFVTVSDILTSRDKQKFPNRKNDFSMSINDINLAEIEKYIESKGEQSQVSKKVNPENLKTIQLTAQKLFVPTTSEAEKSNLQIRWNKELTKVYASFVNLMNIPDVDIRGEYRSDLQTKADERSNNWKNKFEGYKTTNELCDYLELKGAIVNKDVKFSEIKGYFALISINVENKNYIASISHANIITNEIPGLYLFKINNTFSDTKLNSNFNEFKSKFLGSTNQLNCDIWLMFKGGEVSKNKTNKALILNIDNNNNTIFVRENKITGLGLGNPIVSIKDALDTTKYKDIVKKFIVNIDVVSCKLFTMPLSDEWKQKFNLTTDYLSKNPNFYNSENKLLLGQLKEDMKKTK